MSPSLIPRDYRRGMTISTGLAAPAPLTAQVLAGLVADPARLRVLAAIALGAETAADVVAVTGLSERDAAASRRRLEEAGLVVTDATGLAVDSAALRRAARDSRAAADADDTDPGLRAFVRGRRLLSLPAHQGRRRLVLQHIAHSAFTVGERYDEPTVNERLLEWCASGEVDHVALRRYLVDGRLLARRDGAYWLPQDGEPQDLGLGASRVRALGLA